MFADQNTLKLPQVPLSVKTFQVLTLNAYQNNDHAWQWEEALAIVGVVREVSLKGTTRQMGRL